MRIIELTLPTRQEVKENIKRAFIQSDYIYDVCTIGWTRDGFCTAFSADAERWYPMADGGLMPTDARAAIFPTLRFEPNENDKRMLRRNWFFWAGHTWHLINENTAVCSEGFNCSIPFRKEWNAPDARDYEKSDAKKWLENWVDEAIRKPVFFPFTKDEAEMAKVYFDEGPIRARKPV